MTESPGSQAPELEELPDLGQYICSFVEVLHRSIPQLLAVHADHESASMTMATKRLIKELEQYRKDPSPAVSRLEPVSDDDLLQLTAALRGPEGTAYEDGQWDLSIEVPSSYPNTPPTVHFVTPCCHPNVSFQTGEICLDLLKTSWTPAYTVVSTLEAVQQLLSAGGEPDSPLNVDLAKLVRSGDFVGAEGLVRFYTGMYAVKR